MKVVKLQRGDTIVEVLISIAILALALSISYSLANRSLRTALSANARTEATAIAQGQIELLKSARYNNPSSFNTQFANTSRPGSFCVSTSGSRIDGVCDTNGYRSSIVYSTGTSRVFTITTEWDTFNSSNASGKDELKMYYRLPL